MNNFLKYQFLCFLFFLVQQNSFSATYHAIDSVAWQKAVNGLEYSEAPTEPQDVQMHNTTQNAAPVSKTLQVILFIVVIALLVFVLLRIFGKDIFTRNKKIQTGASVNISDLEEKPMETDLERFLREALQRKDFRLAIRIYYLMILQALHEKEIIAWKKNKTNHDYVLETAEKNFSQQFAGNTLLFEYVWYGEKILEETQFNKVHLSFLNLIDNINKKQE